MEFILGGQRTFSWFGKDRFLWLLSVVGLHLLTDPKILRLSDLKVTHSESYTISKSAVKMSIIMLFIVKAETDSASNDEGLNK